MNNYVQHIHRTIRVFCPNRQIQSMPYMNGKHPQCCTAIITKSTGAHVLGVMYKFVTVDGNGMRN
jgi:hypothetical protein